MRKHDFPDEITVTSNPSLVDRIKTIFFIRINISHFLIKVLLLASMFRSLSRQHSLL